MATNAFVIGFFTAMGWFGAHTVIDTLNLKEKPTTIIEQQEK